MNSKMMDEAIRLSREKMRAGMGGPFGAVVVRHDQIVARGCNEVTSSNDPTAHAEIVAIRGACRKLGTFNLADCQIYCSCEPCPMCLAAIYWARIQAVYYANTRADAAHIGFDDERIYRELVSNPADRQIVMRQLQCPEALAVFKEWSAKTDKVPY